MSEVDSLLREVTQTVMLDDHERRLAKLESAPVVQLDAGDGVADLVDVDTTAWPNGLTPAFAPRGLVRSHQVTDGEHVVAYKYNGQSTAWTSLMDRTLLPMPALADGVAYEYELEIVQAPPLDTGVFVGLALRDSALLDRHIVCGGLWYRDTGVVRPISRVADQVVTTTAELGPIGETHPAVLRTASLTFMRRGPGLSPLLVSAFKDAAGHVISMGTRSDWDVVNVDRFMLILGTQSMAAATQRQEDPVIRFRLRSRVLDAFGVPS